MSDIPAQTTETAEAARAAALPAAVATPAPSSEWVQQQCGLAYEQGVKAGRDAAGAEIQQREQSLAREQAQVRDAMARLQRDQKELQQAGQAAERQASAQRESLRRLLEQLPAAWERHLQDAEEDMLALVFETVCRIVGELAVTSEGARAMLQRTLQAWHGRQPLSVHVHPDDLAALRSDASLCQLLFVSGFSGEHQTLRWVADPAVQLGGCLLRSEEGALDARLEVQLQAIRLTLVQAREARRLTQHEQHACEAPLAKGVAEAAR